MEGQPGKSGQDALPGGTRLRGRESWHVQEGQEHNSLLQGLSCGAGSGVLLGEGQAVETPRPAWETEEVRTGRADLKFLLTAFSIWSRLFLGV